MLVIFDCDGVLIDSELIFRAIDAEALTNLGHPTTVHELTRRFCGIPHGEIWATISSEIGLDLPENWFAGLRSERDRRFANNLTAISGAAFAIEDIVKRGHQVCTASSATLSSLHANLERVGLLSLIQPFIFSVEQVRRPKPAPDVFLHAASQMGFDPSECLVVEDSVAGITAARRAEMRCIGFLGGGHVYDGLSEQLKNAGAVGLCPSMNDLYKFIGCSHA
ncbi:HAD-IA family hydrolase [Agrobacterium tumefaciens]|uniref:HAD family hydrolase n=1 Tax=Agrobacterium tumefaciens TaxID=358 RepID=UPI001573436B|nr:HAD-IA family hydrolase [Agrobacterium tumefaciens]